LLLRFLIYNKEGADSECNRGEDRQEELSDSGNVLDVNEYADHSKAN